MSARRASGAAWEADLLSMLTGVLAAWIAFSLLVWAYGESPRAMGALVLSGTWGSAYGLGQVLFKATPLLFSGLAVHFALRAGLFNIGAEGQLMVSSLAVATLGARLPPGTPAALAWPLLFVVAAAAGAIWAALPALLRARYGAHEVISTIMMNSIGSALVGFLLGLGLAQKDTVRTPDIVPGARLPKLDRWVGALHGSAASVALFFGLALVVAVMLLLPRTRAGRELALVAENPVACRAERVPVRARLFQALVVSGALAGLGSLPTVLGYKGYFEQGLGAGAGFAGLAVAILGRGRIAGVIFAALLFGTLAQGGLAINAHVPMEVMDVIQGVVVVAVALGDARVRAWLVDRMRGAARPEEAS